MYPSAGRSHRRRLTVVQAAERGQHAIERVARRTLVRPLREEGRGSETVIPSRNRIERSVRKGREGLHDEGCIGCLRSRSGERRESEEGRWGAQSQVHRGTWHLIGAENEG